MKKQFTLTIFSENHYGLLNSITIIFTRRKINIYSLNTSESEIKGIYRYNIVITSTLEAAQNVAKQIEKLIDVLGAFVYDEEEIIYREIALYKVPTKSFHNGNEVEHLLRRHFARIIRLEKDYTVIEKTGHKDETQALMEELQPYGLIEFVRSGRVAITKPMNHLDDHLEKLEKLSSIQ
ncbi:MAG: acetolactate synthase small subunit [Bacteroidetes bacterium]|nr:acetolactate synthase small subunit [Bacteroidota bacterium]